MDTITDNAYSPPGRPRHEGLHDWLVLLHAPRLGPRGLLKLLEHYGSPQAICEAHLELAPSLRDYLQAPDMAAVEADLAWLEAREGRHILCIDSPLYPPLLRTLSDPPTLLFVAGDPACLSQPQLAIVGSRNPTAGGTDHARAFAADLAQAGLVITSGLALGIDAAAHQGALAAGGQTVAVTGNGLDSIYPARNKALAGEIAQHGAIVSEFPPGTPPLAANFPRRNRIISGLSVGTLVIEAALRSGSLITARLATEQGREVFALPGSVHNPMAKGCHRLIRDGATLVETSADIMAELGSLLGALGEGGNEQGTEDAGGAQNHPLFPHLGHDPVDIDTLVERSGLTAEQVSAMLLALELHGSIEALPGGRYCRS
ncbi:DNA-processing protein DprA [Sulfuriflexus mobilis]|uniref:DNA-processing protein DprA n=1 Tax=Sulfuriflexus mobilis TaxID=1811807 RepID=UPI000F81C265|nr:DNA-processing protein DprA [Sulfuriflexus mobilis]